MPTSTFMSRCPSSNVPGSTQLHRPRGRQAGVRVVGAGAFVPSRTVSNERIARAIPGWSAERIELKTGIRERRFLWDFDEEKGVALAPSAAQRAAPCTNTDMCERALLRALHQAGMHPQELDAVLLVTCTPDRLNFNSDAMELHRRLGCRVDTFALVVDDGCGGTPYVLDLAQRLIRGGGLRTVAVVASAFTSPLLNREVYTAPVTDDPRGKDVWPYLSMYVFGDGAGAVVLRRGESWEGGILASMSGNAHDTLVSRPGGGLLGLPYQPGRTRTSDMAFVVEGFRVARSYPLFMRRCLDAVFESHPELKPEVKRYYFHQPNKRVLDAFAARADLPEHTVACNVDRYGNTSAAGMLILLAEDLENGRVRLGGGDLVVVAAVGANVHYGAQLIRL